MVKAWLECVKCYKTFPIDLVNSRCVDCDEPLEVRYDIDLIPSDWFQVPRKGTLFERYAPFYSYLSINKAFSLGEGQTSLIRSNYINEKIGIKDLFFKNETQNPTWTFKDRGTACAIQNAISLGYKRFGTRSAGNMGASVAAFGSRAKMDTFVLLGPNAPEERVNALMIYGAKAIRVSGSPVDAYLKALEIGKLFNIYFNLSDDPMRVEGYKSLAFEIYEQLERQAPDCLVVPVGSGGLFRGVLKGFEELRQVGFSDRIPKFIGVQPQGCSPTADAFEKGKDRIEPFENPSTLDHFLTNPLPPSGNQVLRKVRSNGGALIKAGNEDILKAQLLLAQEGIFAQPAAATAVAGLIQATELGLISLDSKVVIVITGSGLKYTQVLNGFDFPLITTSTEELADVISSLLE